MAGGSPYPACLKTRYQWKSLRRQWLLRRCQPCVWPTAWHRRSLWLWVTTLLTRFAELVGNSLEMPASPLTANPSGSGWTPGEHLTSQAGELDTKNPIHHQIFLLFWWQYDIFPFSIPQWRVKILRHNKLAHETVTLREDIDIILSVLNGIKLTIVLIVFCKCSNTCLNHLLYVINWQIKTHCFTISGMVGVFLSK